MKPAGPLRVVVTGSESTGKTTLAADLAAHLEAPWSRESARVYVERVARELGPSDVEPIARGQIAGEDCAIAAARGVVIHDTDLISTVVYARHYYGACPAWIVEAARERRADLYLLCHPDVPWVSDGLQRDRGWLREELHSHFVDALAEFGAAVVDVRGDWPERSRLALRAIAERHPQSGAS